VVRAIAGDEKPGYFTYLNDARNRDVEIAVILGDARLSLQAAPPNSYDVLVMDVFSSDAIPMHLMTREALRLYLSKLKPDGILAFNVSSNYLELRPVLARLAEDAGVVACTEDDTFCPPAESKLGKAPSIWVVMARQKDHLQALVKGHPWVPMRPRPGIPLWTDDFSNLVSAIKW
jgi:spermidine synthase